MDEGRFEQLTVGILVKREGGMFKSSGLGVFYDPTKKGEKAKSSAAYGEYDEETIYGKYSRIGGKHKYPNVDPMIIAEQFFETMKLAGIDAEKPVERQLRLDLEGNLGYLVRFPLEDLERGRSIFEFLSTMYYDHRNVLKSFVYLEKAKQNDPGHSTVVTLGPEVTTLSTERFHPIYIGGTQQQDSIVVDKSIRALNFYSVQKQRLVQFMDRIESRHTIFSVSLEDLPADQVAYTHSVMWDSKDLPRGYRANLMRRGLLEAQDKDIDKLVAYSLFPAEMEMRLIESLRLIQKMVDGPTGLLQKYMTVNALIKQVVKDEFFADFS
ncbi:MAG: hypothetical protein KOO63_02015 [Bacteroidales bacterium]|nr:hypothetical protein [Candidatus Latescibacterota bacterium]